VPLNHTEKHLSAAKKRLEKSGVENPALDAEVLLAHILNVERLQLPLLNEFELSPEDSAKFQDVIKRRCEGEPVAYITNKKEFYSKEFYVDENVLIPRPETETVVETAVELIHDKFSEKRPLNILEVGTGSGIISCLLAELLPEAAITATDISDEALEIARKNCASLKLDGRIEFMKSDLFSALEKRKYKSYFQVIISNPPYISEEEYPYLQREIVCFEPPNALIGGETGIEFTKKLLEEGCFFLSKNGCFIIETGYNFEDDIRDIVEKLDVDCSVEFIKDLQGTTRVAMIQKEED